MPREIDSRNFAGSTVTDERRTELEARAEVVLSETGLAGATVPPFAVANVDPTTKNPSLITFEAAEGAAEGLNVGSVGDMVRQALDILQSIAPVLGLTPAQPPEFVPDPNVMQSTGGASSVHVEQQYKAIPIFQAAETVRFDPSGSVASLAGRSVTIDEDLDPTPALPVHEAVLVAARFVATPDEDSDEVDQFGQGLQAPTIDVSSFSPQLVAHFRNKADLPTVVDGGPFGDQIRASLLWFPMTDTDVRLTWEVLLTLPDHTSQYRTIVDAKSGEVLYSRQLVQGIRARGNVFPTDGGETRQVVDFPLSPTVYGLPLADVPPGFPFDWVEADSAVGNTTFAHLGDTPHTLRGAVQNGVVVFNPSDAQGNEQRILNAFYFSCLLHDFFYLLGFREDSGNFQQANVGAGAPQDRVDARAYPGPVPRTASMFTPADGSSPIMKLGLVQATGRHTAMDGTVVAHEYTHGVTNRLVGGPLNIRALEAPQCRAMGEGWGDYIACTLTGRTEVGAWVVGDKKGIRQFRYDASFPAETENFGQLGQGRYSQEHNAGEIWCATLMDLNRTIGTEVAVQLVVDALKLSPANPSFLDMRDSMLAAVELSRRPPAERQTTVNGIWRSFSKFGMGPNARTNGPFFAGIVADFNPPPAQPVSGLAGENGAARPTGPRVATPPGTVVAIPDNDPTGVSSALEFPAPGRIKAVRVAVDIEHPAIDDLQVKLVTPSGTTVVLHDQQSSGAPDLLKSYTSNDTPSLRPIAGGPAQGTWKLMVADVVKKDVGRLRAWSLEIQVEEAEGGEAGLAGDPDARGTELISGLVGGAPTLAVGGEGVRRSLDLVFPSELGAEDFLIAFRAWFQEYGRRAEAIAAVERGYNEARAFMAQEAGLTGSAASTPGGAKSVPWNKMPYYLNFITTW